MHILVSNDDGYRAEGILHLNQALSPLARTTVFAPDRNRSGASNSLTLDVPLRVYEAEKGVHYVAGGTPTDCVHIAISGYFDFEFDLVCSGINDGANLGDDTLYSGTVAAAIEGRFLGLPTVAFSLCMEPDSGRHFDSAARVANALIARLLESPLERGMTLNVNIPDVPYDQLRGIRATRLGGRHRSKPIIPAPDPKGRTVYWIGPAGEGQDAGEGTDFHAIANRYVSVTPLQIDLTRHASLPALTDWLRPLA
ncbi:MAG: 5'/3'-nucleotidase SurE [Steroidobacteraceae bacterium]